MSFIMKAAGATLLAFALVVPATAQTRVVRTTTTEQIVDLPTDTLVRIRMLDTLDSKNWKEGDAFPYEVAQDVIVDGRVAIPAGTKGTGTVTRAREAGSFGRSGKIQMAFGTIPTIGGRTVDLVLSQKAREGNEKEHLAAGASLAGLAVAGPIGLVGGLFVHGKNISIPAGSEMYVATSGRIVEEPRGRAIVR